MREQAQVRRNGDQGTRVPQQDVPSSPQSSLEYTAVAFTGCDQQQARLDTCADSLLVDKAARVSVVIPCYNEEHFVGKVLENMAGQYHGEGYEIIVVDGMSVDGTRDIVMDFITRNPNIQVRLINNPARSIPTGLNVGIEHARGDIIVRMDAHAIPSANYVCRCVELLSDSNISVVGMPCRIRPGANTITARAIALAVAHPFGIGDAKYRLPSVTTIQDVDTVAFGAFRKSLWQELGGFNENLLTNEDYDFHYRVRRRGGRILLDTAGHSVYFARTTIRSLVTQYFRYGSWKAQMVKLHPRSIRWRHLIAPAFVASLILLTVLSVLWTVALWMLLLIVTAYALLSVSSAYNLSRREGDARLTPVISLAFFLIHSTWGSSFLIGLVRSPHR